MTAAKRSGVGERGARRSFSCRFHPALCGRGLPPAPHTACYISGCGWGVYGHVSYLNLSFIHGIIIKIIFDLKPNEKFFTLSLSLSRNESLAIPGRKVSPARAGTRPVGQALDSPWLTPLRLLLLLLLRRAPLQRTPRSDPVLFFFMFWGWFSFLLWVNSKFSSPAGAGGQQEQQQQQRRHIEVTYAGLAAGLAAQGSRKGRGKRHPLTRGLNALGPRTPLRINHPIRRPETEPTLSDV